MKTKEKSGPLHILSLAGMLFCMSVTILSCKEKDVYNSPVITAVLSTDIQPTSAVVSANIATLGSGIISDYGFVWSTTENPTTASSKFSMETSLTAAKGISTKLTGLSPSTKYFLRVYITDDHQTIYSDQATFTTTGLQSPKVTTGEASDVTPASFAVSGQITDVGTGGVTEHGHVISESNQLPTTADSPTKMGAVTSAPKDFKSTFASLKAATTYYVRAYATNAAGTGYGEMKSFKTGSAAVPPTISSLAFYGASSLYCANIFSTWVTANNNNDLSKAANYCDYFNLPTKPIGFTMNYIPGTETITEIGVCMRPAFNPNSIDGQTPDPVVTDAKLNSTNQFVQIMDGQNGKVLDVKFNVQQIQYNATACSGDVAGNKSGVTLNYVNYLVKPYRTNSSLPAQYSVTYKYRPYIITSSGTIYYGSTIQISAISNDVCGPVGPH